MKQQVMLSYNRKDEAFVRMFHKDLVARDVQTWVDWQNIAPGYSWRQALYDGVLESDVMLASLSPAYVTSEMCRMECFLARANNKHIIPIVIEPCYDELPKHFETKGLEDINTLMLIQESDKPTYDNNSVETVLRLIREEFSPLVEEAIYISYPQKQLALAKRLVDDLGAANIPVWIDFMMDLGVDWRDALWSVLKKARGMVVILDPDTVNSMIIKKEILMARTRNLPTFPLVPEEVPANSDIEREMRHALDESYEMRLLSEIQWLRPIPDYETMLEKLKAALLPICQINNSENDGMN